MNLLDPYEPPFKPKPYYDKCGQCGRILGSDNECVEHGWNTSKLEELDRPVVTEDFSDRPVIE